jgi:hypothetical protein
MENARNSYSSIRYEIYSLLIIFVRTKLRDNEATSLVAAHVPLN